MKICNRCQSEYNISNISEKYISKNPLKYEKCAKCRKYKDCEYCKIEFYHHQNRTCSKLCAQKLKEQSLLKSCGTTHNFHRLSKSRKEWENRLIIEEGISNVFQRDDVKEKIKKTCVEKYGVEHPFMNSDIINKAKNTKKERYGNDPLYYKKIWLKIHNRLINKIGYDPRLHILGNASKVSLKVFEPLIQWCLNNNIEYDDIYIGIEGKKEYFLKDYDNNKIYMYDFTIKSKKIIIEYHGIAFHAKTDDENWRCVITNESASDNIKRRNIKNELVQRNGFKLLEIWEDEEVTKNIKKCIKFINKNI